MSRRDVVLYLLVAGVWGDPAGWSVVPYKVELVSGGRRVVEPVEGAVNQFSSTLALWGLAGRKYLEGRQDRTSGRTSKVKVCGLSSLALKLMGGRCGSPDELREAVEECGLDAVRSYLRGVIERQLDPRPDSLEVEVLPTALTQTLKCGSDELVASMRSGGSAFELVKTAALATVTADLVEAACSVAGGGRVVFIADTTHGVNYTTIAFHEAARESVALASLLAPIVCGDGGARQIEFYVYNSDPVTRPTLKPGGRAAYKIHLVYTRVLGVEGIGLGQRLALGVIEGLSCESLRCAVDKLKAELSTLPGGVLKSPPDDSVVKELVYTLTSLAGGVLPWSLCFAGRLKGRLPEDRDPRALIQKLARLYRNYRIEGKINDGFVSFNVKVDAPRTPWALAAIYLILLLEKIASDCGITVARNACTIPLDCLEKYSYLLSEPAKELLEHEVGELRRHAGDLGEGGCREWKEAKQAPDLRVFQAHAGLPGGLTRVCLNNSVLSVKASLNEIVESFLQEKLNRLLKPYLDQASSLHDQGESGSGR